MGTVEALDHGTSKKATMNLQQLAYRRMNGTILSELGRALQETNAVIAGSSVMQSVLGEEWDGTDLDIWLPQVGLGGGGALMNISRIAGLLGDRGYGYPRLGPVWSPGVELSDLRYRRLEKYVDKIITYRNGDVKSAIPVQIIVLRPNVSILDVVTSFDLIASQIYYDGINLFQTDPRAYPQLQSKVVSFSEIALDMQGPFEWLRTINRVSKYFDRGFVIMDDDEWLKVVEAIRHQLVSYPLFAPGWIEHTWDHNKRQNSAIGENASMQLTATRIAAHVVNLRFATRTFESSFDYTIDPSAEREKML